MLAKITISKMMSGERSWAGDPESWGCAVAPDCRSSAEQFRSLTFPNVLACL